MAAPTSETAPVAIVKTDKCFVRPYTLDDALPLATAANHQVITNYMRNSFPNPYTLQDSNFWINSCLTSNPMVNFCICAPDGTPAGGIGLTQGRDVEYRTWEVGYWVAQEHWGKGIATSALRAFSVWAIQQFPEILRLEAGVHSGNEGSLKVLERAGYTKEGVRRKAVCKGGEIRDMITFSLLREEVEGMI
ncbi:acyl-CoA N-acyltransferase [Hypoxylon fragiforme]|uniref:acyl-CoA N-acyltransferase n=1 Tax=Hypoxylon fragiforme TaxID=63214 RepID=UPI0020C6B98C|nr:acyl-CoA N-acyltransferase [Hypoxylon fragiforme]KAI2612681.1 acyl-CoA N-acyltransferase [Hypoxylon fragiforme]